MTARLLGLFQPNVLVLIGEFLVGPPGDILGGSPGDPGLSPVLPPLLRILSCARGLWSSCLVCRGDAGPLSYHGLRVTFSIPEESSWDEGRLNTATTVDTTPARPAHHHVGGPCLLHLYSPHVAFRHPVIHSPRLRS